jgi:hypothetical protein
MFIQQIPFISVHHWLNFDFQNALLCFLEVRGFSTHMPRIRERRGLALESKTARRWDAPPDVV